MYSLQKFIYVEGTDLRQRHSVPPSDDLDILLKYHHSMQEKIADNMLVLARNMKEQSKLAGSIIRKDTEVRFISIYIFCFHRWNMICEYLGMFPMCC